MNESPSFQELLARARAGDGAAAGDLIRQYEPEVRRAVRVRLTDPNLRRMVDSTDICQSVLGNFFVRLAAGQFELADPTQLVKLLVRMARNKVVDHARKPAVSASVTAADGVLEEAVSPGKTPSAMAAGAELIAEVNRRLTPDEKALADQRGEGRGWQEIAAATGVSAEAARKKLERALDRVCAELQIE